MYIYIYINTLYSGDTSNAFLDNDLKWVDNGKVHGFLCRTNFVPVRSGKFEYRARDLFYNKLPIVYRPSGPSCRLYQKVQKRPQIRKKCLTTHSNTGGFQQWSMGSP